MLFVVPVGFNVVFLCSLCYQNIKLSSIKVDTRYTTTQQVVKLIGSHTISKVTVKIGDLKRTKMVRTINLYYNNRTVQAIVELKNKYKCFLGLSFIVVNINSHQNFN